MTTLSLLEHRAALLDVGSFTEADLLHCRSTALLQTPGGEPPPSTEMQVVVAFVVKSTHHVNNSTYYRLLVEGQRVDVSYRLFQAVVDRGAYRIYFTPAGEKLNALEPVARSEVPDAVAEAIVAVGLDPKDRGARTDERVASQVRQRLLTALGRALDFTPNDLAANRGGQLTPREQGKLRSSAVLSFVGASLAAVVGGVLVYDAASDDWRVAAFVGGLAALLALWLAYNGVRRRRDATAGRVVSAVARVIDQLDGGDDRQLTFEDDLVMRVDLKALSLRGFDPSRIAALSYRVYYAPREAEVMSLEPIDIALLLAPAD